MNLPKIEISSLPDLRTLTGAYGSIGTPGQTQGSNDQAAIMMVYVYEKLIQP